MADSTRIRLPDCFVYQRFSKPQPFIGLNVAMESRIIRFIKNILLLGIFKSRADYEDSRKLVLINTICLTAIVVLVLIGSVSLYRGNTMVSLLDMLTAVLLTGCLFYLRRTGKQRAPLRIGIGIITLLYYYMFFSGGADHTGFLWYYTYPVFDAKTGRCDCQPDSYSAIVRLSVDNLAGRNGAIFTGLHASVYPFDAVRFYFFIFI